MLHKTTFRQLLLINLTVLKHFANFPIIEIVQPCHNKADNNFCLRKSRLLPHSVFISLIANFKLRMSKKCRSGNTILRVKPTLFLVKCSQTEKLIQQPLQKLHSRFTQNLPSLPCRSFTTTSGSLGNCMASNVYHILLFSICLAIIIFSDIFYSKKFRKKLIVCPELFGGLGQL